MDETQVTRTGVIQNIVVNEQLRKHEERRGIY